MTSHATDLVPVINLPSGARLQSAGLCAVGPHGGVAAMRRRAVHEPFTHALPAAASALGGKHTKISAGSNRSEL